MRAGELFLKMPVKDIYNPLYFGQRTSCSLSHAYTVGR